MGKQDRGKGRSAKRNSQGGVRQMPQHAIGLGAQIGRDVVGDHGAGGRVDLEALQSALQALHSVQSGQTQASDVGRTRQPAAHRVSPKVVKVIE